MNVFIVFGAIISAVALVAVVSAAVIKRKLNGFTRRYLGQSAGETVRMLSEGLANECKLPYSVPKLTPLYKPKIERDFPEMGFARMESMVRNGIADILNAVESGEPQRVAHSSVRLRDQISGIVEDYRSRGENAHYDNLVIHNVGVESYDSSAESAVAVFQTAVESLFYVTRDGRLVSGSRDKPTQNLFSVTLAHNQNLSADNAGSYIESNCPNCGAPVPAVGARECPYCGSGIVPVVDKIWQIDSFKLLK
ncbi:MAG: zinc ribbon domain-containing protein [Bacteroides sp.]|nr:zinc ribbon domain-containing protein [Bacteroides sp.]